MNSSQFFPLPSLNVDRRGATLTLKLNDKPHSFPDFVLLHHVFHNLPRVFVLFLFPLLSHAVMFPDRLFVDYNQ